MAKQAAAKSEIPPKAMALMKEGPIVIWLKDTHSKDNRVIKEMAIKRATAMVAMRHNNEDVRECMNRERD